MFARDLCLTKATLRAGVVGVLCAGLFSVSAVAQPGRGDGRVPEERGKIQEAQAKSVAADLKLDAEKTASLVSAYAAFQKDAAANRPERGARGDWEAIRKHQEEQQAKLAGGLKAFLDEAQAKSAAETLGGVNRGWDRMVQVLTGFGLEGDKEAEALGHVLTHVKAGATARAGARDAENMEALRTEMETAKKALDASIAPLLSDAQKEEWAAATEWGPRDRGDRRGREGGGREGGGREGGGREGGGREGGGREGGGGGGRGGGGGGN